MFLAASCTGLTESLQPSIKTAQGTAACQSAACLVMRVSSPKSLLISSPEFAHLRTIYFALYKCTH